MSSHLRESSDDRPKSHLVNQFVLLEPLRTIWARDYLQKQKCLEDSCITLEPQSAIHSLQAAQQVRDCLSQACQVVWPSLKQPCWSLQLSLSVGLVDSSACLYSSLLVLIESVSLQSLQLIHACRGEAQFSFIDFLDTLGCLLPENATAGREI